jgi:hypothetical protein
MLPLFHSRPANNVRLELSGNLTENGEGPGGHVMGSLRIENISLNSAMVGIGIFVDLPGRADGLGCYLLRFAVAIAQLHRIFPLAR